MIPETPLAQEVSSRKNNRSCDKRFLYWSYMEPNILKAIETHTQMDYGRITQLSVARILRSKKFSIPKTDFEYLDPILGSRYKEIIKNPNFPLRHIT